MASKNTTYNNKKSDLKRRTSKTITIVYADDDIRELNLKHIQEISKNLAAPKFARLTEDQQDFLTRTGRYGPYNPSGLQEEEEDEEW